MQYDTEAIALIEEHVRRLLAAAGIGVSDVRCRVEADDAKTRLSIAIEAGDDGKLLIGNQGATMAALQHVVRCVLRRQLAENVYITLDVNGYRTRRERATQELATQAAEQALAERRVIVLKPMAAHERRVVHTALAERADVATESAGEEPRRRVLIKPASL